MNTIINYQSYHHSVTSSLIIFDAVFGYNSPQYRYVITRPHSVERIPPPRHTELGTVSLSATGGEQQVGLHRYSAVAAWSSKLYFS